MSFHCIIVSQIETDWEKLLLARFLNVTVNQVKGQQTLEMGLHAIIMTIMFSNKIGVNTKSKNGFKRNEIGNENATKQKV